ncbi:glycine/D-amino acid oxidase-like deaminating enzyme [Inquilinus ginsengisoli]|uniref:Glycine/D-amino acid oxidase-like deaminating enzyme n=1 Tax=Inquilinus ginsengisoli TaxID=363840 RepID=A0ABU1JNZ2_9PROT|nr:FAD-binding oxidoreductase [Inquilinus ginsengisoli]MDR6290345.1 glycine/D-amino acid oxidase-like deaminating enzyme [Inquilinus ginsengisoli]
MGLQVDSVEPDAALPARADVVIVGGGIIGTSAALALARRGVLVALCEKGHIAGEQSSRNWGWCRKTRRDPREIPLIIESMRLWEDMNRSVEAETGFRQTGILFAVETDQEIAEYEAWLEHARPYQLDARLISSAEFDRLMPGAGGRWKAALYSASDGRAEPQRAAPAIARAARQAGATILTDCAVRGIDRAGGRIAAVVTERGRIPCDSVIVAGGAWSRRFLSDLGLRLPQLKVRSSAMRTAPLEGGPETAMWSKQFAFRKRHDGGYTIANGNANVSPIVPDSFRFFGDFLPALRMEWSALKLRVDGRFVQEWREAAPVPLDQPSPYEQVRVLDPAPDRRYTRQAMADLARQFPAFAGAKVVQEWAGLIDVTPDAVPVISTVDTVPGLVVATGFSGHGFGIGPAAGHLAADLATGARPIVDPTAFRFSRFTDGSRPRPMAGV